MGIRGLTTFIAQYSDQFLQRHDLHNTYLVIDGNNICCQLYTWHTKKFDCFGGDYDTFARSIELLFEALKKCNITPIVVFDGNYEWKKLRTIFARHGDRIRTAGKLTPSTERGCTLFPLFTRVMFAEIVKKMGLYMYRCELEADNELACLARALNCPVLSYDSDFYIFDVLYVPFNSLNLVPRYNRINKTWYLDCQLYRTENFLNSFPGLRREHLPLIGTLLGNDYIKPTVFRKFYSHLKLKRAQPNTNLQQRRIRTVIHWLCTETFESAVCKILNRLKMHERKSVAKKIDIIVKGYICCDSIVLKDLDIKYRPKQLSKLELKYNLDDLIENCNKVGNLLDTQNDSSDSEECEEVVSFIDGRIDEEMKTTLEINKDETDDKEDETISSNKSIPVWFVRKHSLCDYPSVIYEIAQGIFFFCTPQIEDYNSKPSHSICFNILSLINKILTQAIYDGEERLLATVGRNDNNGVIKFKMPPFEKEVLALHQIPYLTQDYRLDFMLDALDLSFCKNSLNQVPNDWKLFLLCIFFWTKNASVQIKTSHTLSVYLCAVILKIIDKKIGPVRNLTRIRCKFSKLLENPGNIVNNSNLNNINELFNIISDSESAFTMSNLIPGFHLSDKIARNPKQFDIRIIDAFAQLQCCIFYISALNDLLNNPLEKLIISDFYNGTFLYNMCTNLNKRSDIIAYLKQFLCNSPNVVNVCVILEELHGAKVEKVKKKESRPKRRKKCTKNNSAIEEDVVQEVLEDKKEMFVDKNNSYNILGGTE